jgi:hypothetical protein
VTDPTEQTVTEAVYERFPYSMPLPSETIAVLGIDPDVPLSRLREDLAIAARVRACTYENVEIADSGEYESAVRWNTPDGYTVTFDAGDLLAYLLNGEQP